jgi:hypothetical protein
MLSLITISINIVDTAVWSVIHVVSFMLSVANKTIFLRVTMLSVIMLNVMVPLALLAAVQLH